MAKLGDGVGIRIYQKQFVRGVVIKAGPQGPAGATGNFVNRFQGAWNSGTSYLTGDIVTRSGSTWLAIDPSTNVTPVEGADWTLIASAGTNGTNGQGVPTGGSTSQILAKTSGTDYATAWVSPAVGGVLAYTSFAGTTAAFDKTTTSTTIVDVDAALAVTFTVPSSGAVIVRLSGYHAHTGTAGSTKWALRQSTTTITQGDISAANETGYVSAAFPVTGLTPGASVTYKWAWFTTAGTAAISARNVGPSTFNPPAVMEVLAG